MTLPKKILAGLALAAFACLLVWYMHDDFARWGDEGRTTSIGYAVTVLAAVLTSVLREPRGRVDERTVRVDTIGDLVRFHCQDYEDGVRLARRIFGLAVGFAMVRIGTDLIFHADAARLRFSAMLSAIVVAAGFGVFVLKLRSLRLGVGDLWLDRGRRTLRISPHGSIFDVDLEVDRIHCVWLKANDGEARIPTFVAVTVDGHVFARELVYSCEARAGRLVDAVRQAIEQLRATRRTST